MTFWNLIAKTERDSEIRSDSVRVKIHKSKKVYLF